MENFKVEWTDTHGNLRRSVVFYDKTCAAERVAELKDRGMTDAKAVPVQLGQQPAARPTPPG